MDSRTKVQLRADAKELAKCIVKQYEKYHVKIDIEYSDIMDDRFVFYVNLRGNSRETHLRSHAPDVQQKLQLPLFQVQKDGLTLKIVASRKEIVYPHLPEILSDPDCQETLKEAAFPHVVGHDALGEVVVGDLAKYPHLLLGGSTNSGKSVGLQALITSIAFTKSPSSVNFILIDVGASDLLAFEKLPHLSYPVVRDRITAMHVLAALVTEMERRIRQERTGFLFLSVPELVVVIDEFPSLFIGIEKAEALALIANISSLLQRGRHAKIHLVLAAQNPTFANMRVDLGNITARIAFKCAKKNFSETILGEGGAENLSGRGDMLLKAPAHDLQRVQGTYATKRELAWLVKQISLKYSRKKFKKFRIEIPDDFLTGATETWGENLSCSVVRKRPSEEDRLLASVIMWTLERDSISANVLMATFHLGWNKAVKLIQRLEELGIVDKLEGKLPREVIPHSFVDLPDELMKFLEASGYSKEEVISALDKDILSK